MHTRMYWRACTHTHTCSNTLEELNFSPGSWSSCTDTQVPPPRLWAKDPSEAEFHTQEGLQKSFFYSCPFRNRDITLHMQCIFPPKYHSLTLCHELLVTNCLYNCPNSPMYINHTSWNYSSCYQVFKFSAIRDSRNNMNEHICIGGYFSYNIFCC